ncbi:MAG TPA: hypothetical protein VHG93_11535 [Longimicrobium sp.]|nr:hypothetical protein [Longimicrobium sp.]
MLILRRIFPALALVCAAADPLAAQSKGIIPLSVEARGGIALPREDFRGGADGGVSGELSATWHALPMIGIYAAYQYNRFGWEDTGGHGTDSGFAAGVRVGIPTPLIPIDPWIRAGVVDRQLRAETLSEDSKRGWEVGAGLSFPLARGLTLTPGLLWTSYQHGNGLADGELLQVRHLRADVGVRLRF